MSSEFVWEITRSSSCFVVRRGGVELNREPYHLTNLNSYKYSTLPCNKVVAVTASDKGYLLTTTRRSQFNHPNRVYATVPMNAHIKSTLENVTTTHHYRPDLLQAAQARVAAIRRSRHPKPVKVRKSRKSK